MHTDTLTYTDLVLILCDHYASTLNVSMHIYDASSLIVGLHVSPFSRDLANLHQSLPASFLKRSAHLLVRLDVTQCLLPMYGAFIVTFCDHLSSRSLAKWHPQVHFVHLARHAGSVVAVICSAVFGIAFK